MGKARVRPAPLTKAIDTQGRKRNIMVGKHRDPHSGANASRSKIELALLRESLKAQTRGSNKTKAILDQIKKRYGDAELQRAIREFNAAFHNIPRDPAQGKNPAHG